MRLSHNPLPIALALLTVANAAAQVTYRGLVHTASGNAALFVMPDDTLLVTGVVTSGDGVQIDLTGAQFATGTLADLNAASFSGASWNCTVSAGGPLATLQLFDVGPHWQLFASYPALGAGPVDVEAFFGETPAGSAFGISGPAAEIAAEGWHLTYVRERAGRYETTFVFDPPGSVRLPGNPNFVPATRLVVRSTLTGVLPPVQQVSIGGAGLPDFRITDETLGMFSFEHRALGQATLQASGVCPACALEFGNIGSSGQDGVEVELVGADGYLQQWQPFALPLPDGASFTIASFGTVAGVPDAPIGHIAFTDAGTNLAVTSTLAGVGATLRTVEVRNDGLLVHRLTGQAGALVATLADSDWPIGVSSHTRVQPDLLPGFNAFWPADVAFTLAGGPVAIGDQLVVIGEDAADLPLNLTSQRGTGDDLPRGIVDVGECDAECMGDIDGSNGIDITDLGIGLAHFGQQGVTLNEGDVNGDGENNITDLGFLLANFNTACTGGCGQ